MATISLRRVNKIYPGGKHIVYDFSLEVQDKEFIVFVGPSGCGKSTTLRMIAGLEDISSGEFYIDGELMNDVSPKDRNIAMVFQSYALYPHMSVYENMAFALELKKVPKKIIDEKVKKAAETLELTKYLKAKPKELSGGQRQRVALGRAIVRDAKVFLMDEPLSNLDAKLRVQMRSKIIELHKNLGNTTVYVTHDQIEAMTMASRIVVLKDGYIQQIGTPIEIYNDPANIFVASFIGTPAMNFIKGVVGEDKYLTASDGKTRIAIPTDNFNILNHQGYVGKEVVLGIRPEHIYDGRYYSGNEQNIINPTIEYAELLGNDYNVYFHIGEHQVIAKVRSATPVNVDNPLKIVLDSSKFYFFDPETTTRIRYLLELIPNYRGDGLGTSYNYYFTYEPLIKLIQPGFEKEGFEFLGYALDYNEKDPTKIYQTLLPALVFEEMSYDHTLKLYAIWRRKLEAVE